MNIINSVLIRCLFISLCAWPADGADFQLTPSTIIIGGQNPSLNMTCIPNHSAMTGIFYIIIGRITQAGDRRAIIKITNDPDPVHIVDANYTSRISIDGSISGPSGYLIMSLEDLRCEDATSYYCTAEVDTASDPISDEGAFNVTAQSTPTAPTYSLIDKAFVEYEELQVKCEGDVGLPAGNFVWFAYRDGSHVDFTSLATHEPPTPNSNRSCAFRRESILKLNVTRDDVGLSIRCVVNHTFLQPPPQPSDTCDTDRCIQTGPIEVLYPIREQDLQVSRTPDLPQYIVGSDVILKCDVEGNPIPEFYWKKSGSETVISENKEWLLTKMDLGDSGTYTCYAQNNVSGVTYDAIKAVTISVVATTTTPTTTTLTTSATSPTTTKFKGGVVTAASGDNTAIIIIVVVVIAVVIIIAAVVAIVLVRRRRNKEEVEEPPEKPSNNINLNMCNTIPDDITEEPNLATDGTRQNHVFKNDEGLTYADLKFDDRPRSRRPIMLADNRTDYADIKLPQV